MLSKQARRLRRNRVLAEELEEARQDYLWGHYMPAYLRLMRIMEEVIFEPPVNSKEYQDGERKSETPLHEQEEAEDAEEDAEPEISNGPLPERDEDGYLIR